MAGIALLRKLILKDLLKKSGSGEGITSLKNLPILKVEAETELAKYLKAAERQGVNLDEFSEQKIKYVWELNKPKGPTIGGHEVIGPGHPRHQGITESLFGKKSADVLDLTGKKIDPGKPILGGKNVPEEEGFSMTIAEGPQTGKKITIDEFFEMTGAKNTSKINVVTETVTNIKKMTPMDAMKEANLVIGRKGKYKNLTIDESQDILKKTNDHIFERDIKPDPEDFAGGGRASSGLNYLLGEDDQNVRVPVNQGGRIGFGLGGGFNAARRAFLKVLGAGVATAGVAKSGLFSLLKGGGKKQVVESLTQIPIGSADGMPAWFKPLVNRVIKEGDDVTKKFATKEREIVHQVSIEGKIGSPHALGVEDVRVTQSLDDGTIRVEYNSPDTIGESGVSLVYKKGEEIPIKVKGKNTSVKEKDKFTAMEDDFYPQATGPDGDFDLEFTENIVNKVDDLYSDTSKLKEFATGKKLTIKEIAEATKKKNILKEIDKNPNEHAFRNAPDYDPYPEPDDFASGGRVPLSGGKKALTKEQLEEMLNVKKPKHYKESPLAIPDDWLKRLKEKFNKADGGPCSVTRGKYCSWPTSNCTR